jgi:phosphoglycolate phosphatase
MIGDRSFDVIGAHACSIPAIGVSWGIGSAEELATAGADAVIDLPAQLPTAVTTTRPRPSTSLRVTSCHGWEFITET